MKITLSNTISNTSLQVGDFAYYTLVNPDGIAMTGNANPIGEITSVGVNYIIVDNPGSIPPSGLVAAGNCFLLFRKNNKVNKSGIKGYYAKIRLKNNSTDRVELFSVGSEITESSK